jgi:hypothetical protein
MSRDISPGLLLLGFPSRDAAAAWGAATTSGRVLLNGILKMLEFPLLKGGILHFPQLGV